MIKKIFLWGVLILFVAIIPIASFCWPTLKCLIFENESLWSYVTAAATALLALGLIIAYEQFRFSVMVEQFNFIKEIEKEFYSKRFIKERKNTCSKSDEEIKLDHVVDFFEKVAYLETKDIIDLETIYELWDYWIGHYWVIHKKNIYAFRKKHSDPTYYNRLEKLIKKLAKNYHKNLEEYERENEEDLEDFKKEEQELDSDVD